MTNDLPTHAPNRHTARTRLPPVATKAVYLIELGMSA
jgi:hypothetical protein